MSQTPILHALSVALGVPDTAPDAELLRRFVEANDRSAFELVVRRHAELVWGVCRGALPHDSHAAEDAFQAVFLALARRAASVRDGSAAGWLFRVARNAALRARARSARRATGPLPDALAGGGPPVDEGASQREAAPVVAEEVDRLDAKFRAPVLLCFFEGHTHQEAAARLGWPVGTVASRLARAKDLLRDRLTRRGVVLPAAGLAAVFAAPPVSGALPVRAAVAVATGPADRVPQSVLSLTQGVLSAMRFTRLKSVAAVVAVVAIGVSVALAAVPRDETPQPAPRALLGGARAEPEPPKEKPDPKDLEAKELMALKGEWRVVNLEADPKLSVNGEKVSEAEMATMRAVFAGNELRIESATKKAEEKRKVTENFKVSLAPAGTPKRIDLAINDRNNGAEDFGRVAPGIYELTADTLRVCIRDWAAAPKGRPTEFKVGEAMILFTFERIKDEREELKALAGEWKCRKLNVSGKEAPDEEVAKVRWVIDGVNVETGPGKEEKATIKLDPAASPPAVTLTFRDGGLEAELVGIYFRQGDKLTVCFADPKVKGAARPTELALTDRAVSVLLVLERVPKK
jgi:RNA polymerase sigma factor (sigma-70 family)